MSWVGYRLPVGHLLGISSVASASSKITTYQETVGFTEVDDILRNMTREGIIAREDVLRRLETDGRIPQNPVFDIRESIGVDPSTLSSAVAMLRRIGESGTHCGALAEPDR